MSNPSDPNPFASPSALRAALAAPNIESVTGFDTTAPAHAETWLALTADERRRLLAATPDRGRAPAYARSGGIVGPLPGLIHVVALAWMKGGRAADGLVLFDDLIELSDLPKELYCNALWAIQDDNNKLGVQPERARKYLGACLPHAPTNPAIFYNAAGVLLELGDRDGALSNVELAKSHGYQDIERMRDDACFRALRGDPRFDAVFADIDPPQWTDLEEALLAPEHVRNLELRGVSEVPDGLLRFPNLEVLELCFASIDELPVWLTQLTKLRKLEVNWNARMKKLPDEVLAMPSLREISFYDSGLGKKYQMAQVNALLGGFAKTSPSHETRMLHIALLLENEKVALARGGVRELVDALDSNVAQVRSFAKRVLAKKLGDVDVPLRDGAEVVVVGKLLVDRDVLAERLQRRGMTLGRKVSANTVAVVVGEQHKGKGTALLDGGHLIALEDHLRKLLDEVDPGHLAATKPKAAKGNATRETGEPSEAAASEAGETASKLGELLMSTDSATVSLALDMMKRGGVPAGVLEELFLVMQNATLDKKPREAAKKLFLQYAPTHVQDAVKSIFARTSIYLSGETKVRTRLKALGRRAKGDIDPVKLALLLLPSRRGFSYLFEIAKGDDALALRALTALRSGDALDLSQSELNALPASLAKLEGLTKLDLSGCHLGELSEVLLSMTGLVALDISRNRLDAIPEGIERLAELRTLSLGCNFLKQFPEAVFRLSKLESLDVSTANYDPMRSLPFTSIPLGLGKLTALETLSLSSHHLASLPDDWRSLTKLKVLDLSHGKVGALPAWLADLPSLERLDLEYTEVADATGAAAIAGKLRARGVRVKGLK